MDGNLTTSVDLQILLTLFLVVISSGLHRHVAQRDFLKWWTRGWAAFFFAVLLFRLGVLAPPSVSRIAIRVATVPGLLQIVFFGVGLQLLRGRQAPRDRAIVVISIAAVAVGLTIDFLAPPVTANAQVALGARNFIRSSALAVIFPYSGVLVMRNWRAWRGRRFAIVLTGASFILYGLNQTVYFAESAVALGSALLGVDVLGPRLPWITSPWAFLWDVVWQAGLGFGMLFLLLEEHDRTRRGLAESEERLRATFDSAPYGIAMMSVDGVILGANEALAAIVGRPAAELVGRRLSEFLEAGEGANGVPDPLAAAADAAEIPVEVRRGDAVRHCVIQRAAVRLEGHDVLHYVTQVRDVTDRLELEERMRRAERLEALGMMVGGLAHDLNNALTSVRVNTELIREAVEAARLADQGDLDTLLDDVLTSSAEAARSVDNLLLFTRKGVRRMVELSLGDAVAEELPLVTRDLPEGVTLEYRRNDALPPVLADRHHVRTVLRELVSNAVEACQAGGGSVTVKLDVERADGDYLLSWLPPGPRTRPLVALTVRDTGEGMEPQTLARMFDPFFTTRFQGRGLGLAAVFGIVRDSGWAVRVRSGRDAGTSVTVLMPPT